MNKTIKISSLISIALLVIGFGFYFFLVSVLPLGASAPSGLNTSYRVATTTAVGPDQVITIFSDRQQCSSRIISTVDGTGTAVTFTIADPSNLDISSTTVSIVIGSLQAGSTTVAYDGGLWGCERWTATAFASTTLTLYEME